MRPHVQAVRGGAAAVGIAVLTLIAPASEASHIKGYDLSHSIDSAGAATFVYKVYHVNNLKYPLSTRPATDEPRVLHFGDGPTQSRDAEVVAAALSNCDVDADGDCRIDYRDCAPPGDDATTCETAVTTRTYQHGYACSDPTDIFTAFISKSNDPDDVECCRADGFLNIPDSGGSPITPENDVAPCCENPLRQPNSGPGFSSLPVFEAFQERRYLHSLGVSDPDGDDLALSFLTEPPLSTFSCPAPCLLPPTPDPLTMTAFDPCEDPAGAVMEIDAIDRLDWNMPIAPRIACEETRLGFYGVGVKAVDVCAASAEREFRVELFVEPASEPPEITATPQDPPGLTVCVDQETAVIDLEATDPDLGDTVTLSVNPPGVLNTTFDQTPGNPATGQFTFAPRRADSQLGSHGFTFIATDDTTPKQSAQVSVVIDVIICNRPPVADPGGPYVTECTGTPTDTDLDGTASFDPDGDPIDSYFWTANCPGRVWTDRDTATPTLGRAGAPPCPFGCTVTLFVEDIWGLGHAASTTLDVVDTLPPGAIGVPVDETLSCEDVVPSPPAVTADDACDPSPSLTFGEIRVDGVCEDTYDIVRTWSTRDVCDNEGAYEQTIAVVDALPPTLAGVPADALAECDAVPSPAAVSAIDSCDPSAIGVTFVEGRTDGSCPSRYSLVRTWSARDRCGNEAAASQTVDVDDTMVPVLVGVPADGQAECDALPPPPVVTATDNCSLASVTLDEQREDGPCEASYTLVRRWTASDDCGNQSVAEQRLEVSDSTPPVLVGVPADARADCDAVPLPPDVTATDGCGVATVVFTEEREDGPCESTYTLIRRWRATDDCGNEATAEQRIDISDTESPVLVGVPADALVECDAVPAPPVVTATDDCGVAVVSFAEAREDGPCAASYTLVRSWTATDDCGNESSAEQRLEVVDSTPPALVDVPVDEAASCDAVPARAAVTSTDACSSVTVVVDEERRDGACEDSYTLVRTWTATDACGNEAAAAQSVAVADTTPPALAGVPADATAECDAVPAPPVVTSADDCDPAPVIVETEVRVDGGCVGEFILERAWDARDRCGNLASAAQTLSVVDTTPPVLTVPPALTIECPSPAGIPRADPVIAAWLGSASAVDGCDGAAITDDAPPVIAAACGSVTTVTFTARDDCGNELAASSTITVDDTLAPMVTAMLDPIDPLPPMSSTSAAAPASVCSPPTSRGFVVVCGAEDLCDPDLDFRARLEVTLHDVTDDGVCIERVEQIDVSCDEVVELRLTAPPCPAKPPKRPTSVLSVGSGGIKVVSGESVVLVVTAVDDCGNLGEAHWDPAAEPSPACAEVLEDGTCCPAIGGPQVGKCKEPVCGALGPVAPRGARVRGSPR